MKDKTAVAFNNLRAALADELGVKIDELSIKADAWSYVANGVTIINCIEMHADAEAEDNSGNFIEITADVERSVLDLGDTSENPQITKPYSYRL
jgi:hypothetical protein